MSHEITIRSDNTAEFAHTGPKSAIWHGLGQELEAGADIDCTDDAKITPFFYAAQNGRVELPADC